MSGFSSTVSEEVGETRMRNKLPVLVLLAIMFYLLTFIYAVVVMFG